MGTSIFQAQSDESPTTIIRQTMSVSVDDGGTPIVSFATNKGKGTGAQTMPVSEFREYVETLAEYANLGVPDSGEEGSISAAESLRRTIKVDDGILSFRTRSGKGSKPAKFAADSLGDVAKLLLGTLEAVESAGSSLLGDDS